MSINKTNYFKISLFVVSGIIIGGFLLELLNLKPISFIYPYNLYVILLLVVFLLSIRIFFKITFLFRWLSSLENSLVVIIAFVFLILISAIIPQHRLNGLLDLLSLNRILYSYYFVFTYLYLLITLGLVVLRRINNDYSLKNISFFLNHFGLWLILIGGGFGSADFVKLDLIAKLNNTVWYGYTENNEVKELPFAIVLKEFQMKTYLPKVQLAVIDSQTKSFNIIKQWELDTSKELKYEDIKIKVLEYSPYSWFLNKDSVVKMKAPGYINAAYIKMKLNNKEKEGWISNNSLMQKGKYLVLNSDTCLILSKPLAKEFISYIKVYTSKNNIFDTVVKVNKPINIMGWNVYQKDYNKDLGEYSDYSVFEINKDPWLGVVYTGIIMLIIGSIMLIFVNKIS